MKMLHLVLAISVAALLGASRGIGAENEKLAAQKPARAAGSAARPLVNPETRLKMLTEKLSLTPDQQEKVKAVYAKHAATLKTMREDKSLSEEAKREKFSEMRRTESQEIQAVLSPEQQGKMRELFRERARGAGAAGQRPAQKPEAK